jgi:hypothetical protein
MNALQDGWGGFDLEREGSPVTDREAKGCFSEVHPFPQPLLH